MANNKKQIEQQMQLRSLRWNELQKQKEQETDRNKRNEIGKQQAMLHAQNVADAKAIRARYDQGSGEWRTGSARNTSVINTPKAAVRGINEAVSKDISRTTRKLGAAAGTNALASIAASNQAAQAKKVTLPTKFDTPTNAGGYAAASGAGQAARTVPAVGSSYAAASGLRTLPTGTGLGGTSGLVNAVKSAPGMIAHNTGAGVARAVGDAYKGIDLLLPDFAKPRFVQDYIDSAIANADNITGKVQAVNREKGGTVGEIAGGLYQSGIAMLPTALITAMSGGATLFGYGSQLGPAGGSAAVRALQGMVSKPAFAGSFVTQAGTAYDEAKKAGAGELAATVNALGTGFLNAGIEMSGGLEGEKRQNGLRGLLQTAHEEGLEEVKQGIVSGLGAKAAYDKARPWVGDGGVIDPKQAAMDYAGGAIVGGVVSAPGALRGARAVNVRNDVQTEVQSQETPVQKDKVQESVTLPTRFEGTAQDAAYRAQIDGVFDGSLPERYNITIGDTPDILLSFGASDIPMKMTQSTARKIAYPAGYEIGGKNMGGSHNLGIPALKSLPEQLRDPVAVLKSKTQPGSLVILTEWNDTNGNPVVAAIHLDKQGFVNVSNEVASAYGKNNFAALVGENGENVLYTKKDKSIDELLYGRLQLPATSKDDTLVAHSLAQGGGNVNTGLPTSFGDAEQERVSLPTQFNEGAKEIPNPGLLRRGVWGADEVKPRLGSDESERRPESRMRLPEEDLTLAQQLEAFENQLAEQESAAAQPTEEAGQARRKLEAGDVVRSVERGNIGVVTRTNYDGSYRVRFVNQETGEQSTIRMFDGELELVTDEDIPLTPESIDKAVGQLKELMSDSFAQPDQEMRESLKPMAERAEIPEYSVEELDKLLAESYVNQNADLPSRKGLEQRFSDKAKGNLNDIRELLAEADEQGARTIIPQEVALRLHKVRGAYNKTIGRVLDQAAGKDGKLREALRDLIERPLAQGKGDYARGVKADLDGYAKEMQRLGIRKGSKESAAVMWYGEGQRVNQAGDTVPYTEADLRKDFPKSWKSIKEANAINRRMYDDFLEKINRAREIVYPQAELKVKLEIAKARAKSAAYSEQIAALDKRIQSGNAGSEDAGARAILVREMQAADEKAIQLQRDLDSGEALRGKRLKGRKDFYHHFQEMAEGFGALRGILSTDAEIDPRLVGTSDNTKPKAKWQGVMQRRNTNRTVYDSVGAMLDYIPAAEFMINIDPQIARLRTIVRDLVDGTADAGQSNANSLIEWMTDYTNDIAGKTNPFDRALQKKFGRKTMKVLQWINGRVKSDAILGNLNSATSQWFNLPNGVAMIKNPVDLANGMKDYVESLAGDSAARRALDQSDFMTERYLDEAEAQFDDRLLQQPKKFATWLLTVGDKQASQVIWFSAYEQGMRKGVKDPIFYADDITQRSVGGRGIGEVPLEQQSKITQLLAPFQVEVNNTYQLIKERVGKKDAMGLALLFLTTFVMNELKEKLTGSRTGMDLIDAGMDAGKELAEMDEAGVWDYVQTIGGRLAGEFVSNMPYGAQAAQLLVSDDTQREKLFGESDPTRFGTGNIGIDAIVEPAVRLFNGQTVDPTELATNFLLPWGGKQVSRAKTALEDYGVIPKIRVGRQIAENENPLIDRAGILQYGVQPIVGAYNDEGTQLKFAPDDDPFNMIKAGAFGRNATDSGKQYIEDGSKMLSEDDTRVYNEASLVGLSRQQAYEAIKAINAVKAPEDKTKTRKQAQREAIMQMDLTPGQKAWLDFRMTGGGDHTIDYRDAVGFEITNYLPDSLQQTAQKAYDKFGVQPLTALEWSDRLKEAKKPKDVSNAQARLQVLDEITKDRSLGALEQKGLIRYILMDDMSEKWTASYGQPFIGDLSAEDCIRFYAAEEQISEEIKADTSIHENDRAAFKAARIDEYLAGMPGLSFQQEERLRFFLNAGKTEMTDHWAEIIRKTTSADKDEQELRRNALSSLQESGMNESLYRVIKSGIGRVQGDKDAEGKTITGTKKANIITYLRKWRDAGEITDAQIEDLMRNQGYKYGTGEKPKSTTTKVKVSLPTFKATKSGAFKLPSLPTRF